MKQYAQHGRHGPYIPGDHWVTCDRCGFTYRNSVMRQEWTGLVVCPQDFEMRHPQDFVRSVQEDTSAKGHVRSDPDNIVFDAAYVEPGYWKLGYTLGDLPVINNDEAEGI